MAKWAVRFSLVLIIGMLLGVSWRIDASRIAREDPTMLLERPWVDHFPNSDQEPFRFFRFSRDSVGIYAVFDSRYKVTLELFEFDQEGNELHFEFPHDNTRAVTPYAIDRVKEGQFDLKLTLKKDPRNRTEQQVYYSRTDWRDEAHWPAILKQALPH
ncbi:MAG: hypothetical protein ACYCW6_18680 [Candidatus Xenobia bacterium]